MKKLFLTVCFILISSYAFSNNLTQTESKKSFNTFFIENVCYEFTSTCGKVAYFESVDGPATNEALWIYCQNLNVQLCGSRFDALIIEP